MMLKVLFYYLMQSVLCRIGPIQRLLKVRFFFFISFKCYMIFKTICDFNAILTISDFIVYFFLSEPFLFPFLYSSPFSKAMFPEVVSE